MPGRGGPGSHGTQNHRVAVLDDDRGACLASQLARFKRENVLSNLFFYTYLHFHASCTFTSRPERLRESPVKSHGYESHHGSTGSRNAFTSNVR